MAKLKTLIAVALLAGWLCACEDKQARSAATFWLYFLDVSVSIAPDEYARWIDIAEKDLRALKPGDAVEVFLVGTGTAELPPVYSRHSLPLGEGLDAELRCKKSLRDMRTGLAEALKQAVQMRRPAPATDLLGMVDRVARSRAHTGPIRVTVFSDMLQAGPEMNVERHIPTEATAVDAAIRSVAASHGWSGDTLAGVEVRCYLTVGVRPLGQRQALEQLWRTLLEALGAKVERFDVI